MSAIPALADCKPGLRPTGFNLIVAVAAAKPVTAGGLHLPDGYVEKERLTEVRGRVVAMSPACFDFARFPEGSTPVEGDAVQFAKLAGIMTTGADGREYRVLLDKDITAIIEEAA